MNEPKACYNCRHEDVDHHNWPCNKCDPRTLNKWEPQQSCDEDNSISVDPGEFMRFK